MTEELKQAARQALPEITEEDRQFLHDNPNTGDLVAWVQKYARRAVDALTQRTGWCVFGASWAPQVWMPLDAHRAQLAAAQAKGGA